jgi:dihydroneopterin aldolase
MSEISLIGMEFFAHHGFYKEEQIIGARFQVDFHCEVDTTTAELTDDLKKTLNYQSVYQIILEEMKHKSKLLEHIARRVLDRICSEFPAIQWAEVRISKMNPPVGGQLERVAVKLCTGKRSC